MSPITVRYQVPKQVLTPEEIIAKVCRYFGIPVDVLRSKTRKREIVLARQMSMALIKSHTKLSLKTIGEHFGARDHTTVIHSCKTLKDLTDTDKTINLDFLHLQNLINDN